MIRNISWVIRMKPDCWFVWPKLLPTANVLLPWRARTFGRLNRLSISIFTWALREPPRRKYLMNDASTFAWPGVRRSVIVRGVLPKLPKVTSEKAAGLIQVALG